LRPRKQLVLLADVLPAEFALQLVSFLLEPADQVPETLVDVPQLGVFQTKDLLAHVRNKRTVVVIDALSVKHQLVQVVHILLDNSSDVFQLSELVAVVLGKHALGADYLVAEFAKIFNLFLGMTTAEHLRLLLLALHPSQERRVLLLLLHHPGLFFL